MTVFELETCIEEYGAEVYSFCLHLTGVREWAEAYRTGTVHGCTG